MVLAMMSWANASRSLSWWMAARASSRPSWPCGPSAGAPGRGAARLRGRRREAHRSAGRDPAGRLGRGRHELAVDEHLARVARLAESRRGPRPVRGLKSLRGRSHQLACHRGHGSPSGRRRIAARHAGPGRPCGIRRLAVLAVAAGLGLPCGSRRTCRRCAARGSAARRPGRCDRPGSLGRRIVSGCGIDDRYARDHVPSSPRSAGTPAANERASMARLPSGFTSVTSKTPSRSREAVGSR